MRLKSWTKIHPEYAGNPFIERLPGPQRISEDFRMLQMNVNYDETERYHEPHHRRIFARRILDYMHPIRNQTLIPEFLRMAIYEGYKDRNPRNPSYKAKIIQSAVQLDQVRKREKALSGFPRALEDQRRAWVLHPRLSWHGEIAHGRPDYKRLPEQNCT